MSEHMSPIPSRIYNAAVGGHVAGADQIIDDETGLTLDKITGGALEEKTYTSGSDNGMGRVVLRKNLVNGVNTLVQTMINKSNTIYIIQYDFTLGEDITVPENCVLEFDGGSISGEHSVTLQSTEIKGNPIINVSLNGSCANIIAFQNWFKNNDIDKWLYFVGHVDGPVTYEFTQGEYNATVAVNKGVDKAIIVNGNGAKVNYAESNVAASAIGNSYGVLYIHPKNTDFQSVNITAAIVRGDQSFSVADASGFSVGDTVAIKDNKTSSFWSARDYQEGEFVRITKITGNTLYTANIIEGYYENVGYLTATKVDMIDYKITNLHINQVNFSATPLLTYGIAILLGTGIAENVKVTGFEYNLRFFFCWNISISNCVAINAEVEYTTDGYALFVGNSQDVTIIGGLYVGRNHGISTGGSYRGMYAIVVRNVLIENCETSNTIAHNSKISINTHGNTDLITITNCKCTGIDVSGKRITVTNNRADNNISIRAANDWSHLVSGNIAKLIQVTMADENSDIYEHEFGNIHVNTDVQYLRIHNNISNEFNVFVNLNGNESIDATKLYTTITDNKVLEHLNVFLSGNNNIRTYSALNDGGTVLMRDNDFNDTSRTIITAKEIVMVGCIIRNSYAANNIRLYAIYATIDRCDMIYDESVSQELDLYTIDCNIKNSRVNYTVLQLVDGTPSNIRSSFDFKENEVLGSSANYYIRNFKTLCDVDIQNNRIIGSAVQIILQSGTLDASSTFVVGKNYNDAGNFCGLNNNDTYNIVGLLKFENGIPLWWNGTAWVDATGTQV